VLIAVALEEKHIADYLVSEMSDVDDGMNVIEYDVQERDWAVEDILKDY